jgi:hypothetical protein
MKSFQNSTVYAFTIGLITSLIMEFSHRPQGINTIIILTITVSIQLSEFPINSVRPQIIIALFPKILREKTGPSRILLIQCLKLQAKIRVSLSMEDV